MRFHHYGFEVRDLQASLAFYRDILGLAPTGELKFLEEDLVFLASSNGFQIELISKKDGSCKKLSSRIHFCLEIPCLDEQVSLLADRGYLPAEGPYLLENGWKIIFYEGPDDEMIEFIELP